VIPLMAEPFEPRRGDTKGPVFGQALVLTASLRSVDDGLRDLLLQLSPAARDKLRTVLIRDDRDEIAAELLRYGDASG